jgi:DNA-binding GntR family transcriptional regulator
MNPRRLTVTIAEHQAILDGIIASDPAAAAAALRHHIDTVMVELIAFARRHPDLFADGRQMLATPGYDSFPFG